MNTRLAIKLIALALLSGCAGTPTWDSGTFPEQVVYGGPAKTAPIAEAPAK